MQEKTRGPGSVIESGREEKQGKGEVWVPRARIACYSKRSKLSYSGGKLHHGVQMPS